MSRDKLLALLLLLLAAAEAAAIAWYRKAAVPGANEPGAAVFNLTGVAGRGVWTLEEVNGLNYWWKDFEPAVLYVPAGSEVVINLRSADLYHQFYIPGFTVEPVDIEPGHMRTVRFRADRAGVFQYYCTAMCGSCHFYMRGWLVVTAAGSEPVRPPRILCGRCRDELPPMRADAGLVEQGAWLYEANGCSTCHGPEGRGGVDNVNANNSPVPRHDTTAQKLFLATAEDAEAFEELLEAHAGLEGLEEEPEIAGFPLVRARYENAREIIRHGRYSGKLNPVGPEPPLQMPAWQYLVGDREIDALLAYFVSLYPWNDDAMATGG